MGQVEVKEPTTRPLTDIIKEVLREVENIRASGVATDENIKDLRWKFDQVSAKMNQAIYNNQTDLIHSTCLETVTVLIEMLARS